VTPSRIGVDVGGTFTDVIFTRADGDAVVRKLLSTPPTYDRAVLAGVRELSGGEEALAEIIHGTTIATNAVLERRGSPTALVTTAGFRDVLELRRLRVPHMYDPFWRKPAPLVARRLRFEIAERVAADGTVLRRLDEAEARALAARLRETSVESIAVCLLHSYSHPEHERALGRILANELPEASISLSSDVVREQREYERTATTVVNAYVRPLMSSYLDRLRAGLDAGGLAAPLRIMQSS
jgi:N-methylhydantoinase A/oxoprolinase/acetone carboxylase beta subunit